MNTHYSRGCTNWGRKHQLLVKVLFFVASFLSSMLLCLKIFEMMDAKARQDCIKEIDLLKVRMFIITFFSFLSLFLEFCCLFVLFCGKNCFQVGK